MIPPFTTKLVVDLLRSTLPQLIFFILALRYTHHLRPRFTKSTIRSDTRFGLPTSPLTHQGRAATWPGHNRRKKHALSACAVCRDIFVRCAHALILNLFDPLLVIPHLTLTQPCAAPCRSQCAAGTLRRRMTGIRDTPTSTHPHTTHKVR